MRNAKVRLLAAGGQKQYWRRKKRKEQKTRAVASLETRMRVVASIEVRSTPGGRECYICEWLYGPCVASYDLKLKRLGSPYSKDSDAVLPSFAKLAMSCSNPSYYSTLKTLRNTPHGNYRPSLGRYTVQCGERVGGLKIKKVLRRGFRS